MEIKVLSSGSAGNCYYISDGSTNLLLDAGIPIKEIQKGLKYQLSKIRGCLVTHYHGDHSKAINYLLRRGIDVYIPQLEAEQCKIELVTSRLKTFTPSKEKNFQTFEVGTFTVLPFHVEHDTPDPVGYLLRSNVTGEKLVYFTDTYYLRYTFSGVTHIIGECNYDDETLWENIGNRDMPSVRAKRLFQSHMSLENYLAFLRTCDLSELRQIYICHMSDGNGNEERIKRQVQQLTGAEVYVC